MPLFQERRLRRTATWSLSPVCPAQKGKLRRVWLGYIEVPQDLEDPKDRIRVWQIMRIDIEIRKKKADNYGFFETYKRSIFC
jgi:hypothetical protein